MSPQYNPQMYIDPNTRYPLSMFEANGKEVVIFGYEQHCRAKLNGLLEQKPEPEAVSKAPRLAR